MGGDYGEGAVDGGIGAIEAWLYEGAERWHVWRFVVEEGFIEASEEAWC